MTDIQLKKHLKKLAKVFGFFIILILILVIYVLYSKKADLTIYTNAESDLQALGINEDEFREYLSIIGYMANSDEDEEKLNVSACFIDTLCSSYEPEILEDGSKIYDMNVINDVLKELIGDYIKEVGENSNYYVFDKQNNSCTKLQEPEKIPYCTEIENIEEKDSEIEVTYQLALMTNEQKAEFMTNKDLKIETIKLKATITNNTDYKYSKYFISNIEVN